MKLTWAVFFSPRLMGGRDLAGAALRVGTYFYSPHKQGTYLPTYIPSFMAGNPSKYGSGALSIRWTTANTP